METDTSRYNDIMGLPHPVSETHPQMSIYDRAAQFSPFRALTGHEQAIRETERLTDRPPELDEERLQALNARLLLLREYLEEQPEITLCYFQPDIRKEGGAYRTISGAVRKLDLTAGILTFTNGNKIPVKDIISMEGELFSALAFL